MEKEKHNCRRQRPKCHFSPVKGWMNDPNGPVFYQGEYHLFFQHDPDSLVWDTMHWGHAKSKDLVHWEQMPIALFPDEQGVIYSGCAFVDKENISGWGTKESPALLLFYTSHNMLTAREMQCLAYTTDCVHFYKYEGNPILPGKEHTPARDPQVFLNRIIGGFSMVITTEKEVEFYHSDNFLEWEKTGALRLPEYALSGMIECPCMFETKGENGVTKTVLVLSMDVSDSQFGKFPEQSVPHARCMQYFVGDFDGRKFTVDEEQKEVLLVDHGPNFYAGTVFANVEDTILIAWLGDFSEEERHTPMEREGFRGIQSYPRKLSLRKTEKGYRLYHVFYPDPAAFNGELSYRKNGNEEEIKDGCVTEILGENGLFPVTRILPV